MRNMTITVDEEVARWARVWAAEHDTSVSRFVGELLRERMVEDKGYELAMREYLAREPEHVSGGMRYPAREELYDRRGLR
jgi:hypothetical protein